MTTMDYTSTMRALGGLKVETASLVCLGCGYERDCSTHGCAIVRNAMEHMEAQLHLFDAYDAAMRENEELKRMLADSEEARSDLFRQLAAARKQVDELTKAGLIATEKANKAIAERDAALLMKWEGVRADDLPDLQEEL